MHILGGLLLALSGAQIGLGATALALVLMVLGSLLIPDRHKEV